jgi:hypothetical protein
LDEDLLCGRCRYNLRGVKSGHCPECGIKFNRHRLLSTLLPWERRRYTGRVRSFLATTWVVCFRAPLFAAAAAHELLDPHAGRQFRRVTSLLVCLAPLVLLHLLHRAQPGAGARLDHFRDAWRVFVSDGFFVHLVAAGAVLWVTSGLALVDGAAVVVPGPLRPRARALLRYACAPLVLVLAPAVILVPVLRLERAALPTRMNDFANWVTQTWSGQVALWGGLLVVFSLMTMLRRVAVALRSCGAGAARARLVTLTLPVIWSVLLPLCVIGVPLLGLYLILLLHAWTSGGLGQ